MKAIRRIASWVLIGAGVLVGVASLTNANIQQSIHGMSPTILVAENGPTFPPPPPPPPPPSRA